MSFIISLLVLLAVSRIAGELTERYLQSAIIGEILAGVILGPSVFNIVHISSELTAIASLGLLLFVFLQGLEIDFTLLLKEFQSKNIWISIFGFVFPFLIGALSGFILELDTMRILFLGLCIAITALPVSIRILMDLGQVHKDIGRRIITASVASDIFALLVLGIILDIKNSNGDWNSLLPTILITIGEVLIFVVAVVIISRLIRYSFVFFLAARGSINFLIAKLRGKEPLFSVSLLFVLCFAAFSEIIGLHFVIGAFFGAMLLNHQILNKTNLEEVRNTASGITMGFFMPLFFASIGLEFNIHTIDNWMLIIIVISSAFLSKIIAGWLGGKFAGLSSKESLALGIGLNGRGIIELVIANIALSNGFIGHRLFSILVLMGMVTTIATPPLLRWALKIPYKNRLYSNIIEPTQKKIT
jgi:Kef-type K+ transport system membrane component KefB